MFINLHTHDCKGSIRDAIAKPKEIAERIKELGQDGYAITNHGSTSSLLTHYKICKKLDLKFIFGLEAYITDYTSIKERGDYQHICLLAKTYEGYLNILRLATISYKEENFYYKPRIDWNILKDHLDGLIITSACLGGILGLKDENGNFKVSEIQTKAKSFKEMFGDNFYIEIHTNEMNEQIEFNNILYNVCKFYDIKPIGACDAHYVNKSDAWVHRQWNGIDDNDESGYYQTDDFYLHSEDEVREKLSYLPKAFVEQCINNTVEIYNRCNVDLPLGENNFPVYKCNDQIEEVKSICRDGWRAKIIPFIPNNQRQQYLDRFLEELTILEKANYLNMMLITWDYMRWGKENGIRFGTGRGSVGGSLVAYLMDLTKVDPVFHNLTFSRFCNLERVTTADIDVDVEQRNRHRVIDYLKDKYGFVHQVRTFTAMGAKAALMRAGMCLGIAPTKIRELSKQINEDKSIKDDKERFNLIPQTKEYKQLIELAKSFVGIIANTSVHASAVLVFPKDPSNFCAIEKQGDTYVASYDYHELEELGLAKIDVLGLKNLDIIEETLQQLAIKGISIDLDNIPMDDTKTYDLLCDCKTNGVFQIESNIMKQLLKGIQPREFKDLYALVAIGRPAVLSLGLHNEYIRIKNESEIK